MVVMVIVVVIVVVVMMVMVKMVVLHGCGDGGDNAKNCFFTWKISDIEFSSKSCYNKSSGLNLPKYCVKLC